MNETGYDELARLDDDDAQVADGEIIGADAFEAAEADPETDLTGRPSTAVRVRLGRHVGRLGLAARSADLVRGLLTEREVPA